jgi:hypothetical protein
MRSAASRACIALAAQGGQQPAPNAVRVLACLSSRSIRSRPSLSQRSAALTAARGRAPLRERKRPRRRRGCGATPPCCRRSPDLWPCALPCPLGVSSQLRCRHPAAAQRQCAGAVAAAPAKGARCSCGAARCRELGPPPDAHLVLVPRALSAPSLPASQPSPSLKPAGQPERLRRPQGSLSSARSGALGCALAAADELGGCLLHPRTSKRAWCACVHLAQTGGVPQHGAGAEPAHGFLARRGRHRASGLAASPPSRRRPSSLPLRKGMLRAQQGSRALHGMLLRRCADLDGSCRAEGEGGGKGSVRGLHLLRAARRDA